MMNEDEKAVLHSIKDDFCGIATRNNLQWELKFGGDSKRLSKAIAGIKRKGLIEVFRADDPADRFIYKIKER